MGEVLRGAIPSQSHPGPEKLPYHLRPDALRKVLPQSAAMLEGRRLRPRGERALLLPGGRARPPGTGMRPSRRSAVLGRRLRPGPGHGVHGRLVPRRLVVGGGRLRLVGVAGRIPPEPRRRSRRRRRRPRARDQSARRSDARSCPSETPSRSARP
jgi:hypothetical protein